MTSGSEYNRTADGLWLLVSLVAALSVWILNGAPLFYHDTFGYLEQGHKMVDLFIQSGAEPGGASAKGASVNADGGVVGARSAVYGFLIGGLDRLAGLNLVVFAQLSVVVVTTWMVGRVFRRVGPFRPRDAIFVSIPIFAASLGALPFFVAFLMPDIFTGILLITLSLLVVAWPTMRLWEIC